MQCIILFLWTNFQSFKHYWSAAKNTNFIFKHFNNILISITQVLCIFIKNFAWRAPQVSNLILIGNTWLIAFKEPDLTNFYGFTCLVNKSTQNKNHECFQFILFHYCVSINIKITMPDHRYSSKLQGSKDCSARVLKKEERGAIDSKWIGQKTFMLSIDLRYLPI